MNNAEISKNKVLIIAEAGVNHNGNLDTALKMIDAAKECGADVIKFQTFNPDSLVSRNTEMADYQKKNTGLSWTQKEMLEALALSNDDFLILYDYCHKKNISFLSTPFDIESIGFLNDIQDIWKIPSGELNDYPYLIEIAQTHKPVILSTGMSTIEEIAKTIDLLKRNGAGYISLLHCTTEYPTPYDDVNLKVIQSLKDYFKCDVGYSDHTKGIEIPIAAVALGAVIIEKHFTLDRNMSGPDHLASLEPDELSSMIRSIRNIEKSIGDGLKRVSPEELTNRIAVRKSIVARTPIKKGDLLTENNITTKRPSGGINPMNWPSIIGTKAIHDFDCDDYIET